jgi:MOSC domain-containing protein YiiM
VGAYATVAEPGTVRVGDAVVIEQPADDGPTNDR